MFRVFSAVFVCFSWVLLGLRRVEKSLVFWVVFLGFYLNTKEWKIRVVAPYRANFAILSLRYPISRDTFSGRITVPQNGVIHPPLGT